MPDSKLTRSTTCKIPAVVLIYVFCAIADMLCYCIKLAVASPIALTPETVQPSKPERPKKWLGVMVKLSATA